MLLRPDLKRNLHITIYPCSHVWKPFKDTSRRQNNCTCLIQIWQLCVNVLATLNTLMNDCCYIEQVICGGRGKDRLVYTTVGHTVDIQLHTQMSQTNRRYFILHFKGNLIHFIYSEGKTAVDVVCRKYWNIFIVYSHLVPNIIDRSFVLCNWKTKLCLLFEDVFFFVKHLTFAFYTPLPIRDNPFDVLRTLAIF